MCPYCVRGAPSWPGRGSASPICLSSGCHVVLCKPSFSVSTPELFSRIDAVRLPLDRTPPACSPRCGRGSVGWPAGCTTCLRMYCPPQGRGGGGHQAGADSARGAGCVHERHRAPVFGLFDGREAAQCAYAELQENHQKKLPDQKLPGRSSCKIWYSAGKTVQTVEYSTYDLDGNFMRKTNKAAALPR